MINLHLRMEVFNFYIKLVLVISLIMQIKSNESSNENSKDNQVLVHFMDLKQNELLEILPNVKKALADSLVEFCSETKCSNSNSKLNFTEKDIGFIGNTDKEKFHEEGRFVISKMTVTIPYQDEPEDLGEDGENLLSKDLLEEFLIKKRSTIVKDGKAEIAFVNNKLVYPERNNLDNWLIISISCAFCVLLILINLICNIRSNKAVNNQSSKKTEIYKANEKDQSSKLPRSESWKDIDDKNKRLDLVENDYPLLNAKINDKPGADNQRYLEPAQRFPIPNQPMLFTNSKGLSNIKTNPNYKLSQV